VLSLTKSGANTLSYTIGNAGASGNTQGLGSVLARATNGVLIIQTSAADLGTGTSNNENFLVNGTAPTLQGVNNMVNASIVTLEAER